MISFFVFILIFGILIVVHEFGHFIMAKKVGIRVEKFSLGFGKALFNKKKGDTDYIISAVPLGGYVKLAGDSAEEFKGKPDEYLSKTAGQRAAVIFSGPLLNYLLGFFVFWLIFFTGYPTDTTKVGRLKEGFGAQKAGLQSGDRITAVDGVKVKYFGDLQNIIFAKKESSVAKLTVMRDDKELNFDVNLQETEGKDLFGKKVSVGLIGIEPSGEKVIVRHGFAESFLLGLQRTWDLTLMTYKALWFMITGKLSVRDSVTGVVGILVITNNMVHLGLIAVLYLVAALNISLCIFNLLPLPVLDGGHLFLLGLEKIRKKPLSVKAEQVVTQFGLTLIITLAVLVTINDLVRFKDKILGFFIK